MTSTDYTDEFGITGPVPVDSAARSMPDEALTFGLDVDDIAPDIVLPSASGQLVDVHRDRGGLKACVVFLRSAVW